MSTNTWRRCSSCKKEIPLLGLYYVCSVSTCRQKKTDYVFCGLECWDRHIPVERHRGDTASAIEKRAPKVPEGESVENEPKRIVVSSSPSVARGDSSVDGEILVVVSKVKKYINDRSGFNTSASAMDALTEHIKRECDKAILKAREAGRKTVMDRDF